MSIPAPVLIQADSTGSNNVVFWNGVYYVVPQSLGPIDISQIATAQALDNHNTITFHDTLQKAVAPALNNGRGAHVTPGMSQVGSAAKPGH